MFQSTYEIPSGNLTGVAHGFLGGWQVNASAFWQSGTVFDVSNANAQTNNGGSDRPNLVGDPNLPESERTFNRWFNTSAFALQPAVHRGEHPEQLDERADPATARSLVLQEREPWSGTAGSSCGGRSTT